MRSLAAVAPITHIAADWPKLIWVLDARDEKHLMPIATCPLPSPEGYANRGGRFGAHNIHENTPRPTMRQRQSIRAQSAWR